MNVLIVNAFGQNRKGSRLFEDFEKEIRKIFHVLKKELGIENAEFFIRDHNNIDDFLYDSKSNNPSNITNKKLFDKLDFVFIDGCESFLPWKRNAMKLLLFLKLCKTENKCLFSGSIGFQNLIYFLSTDYNTDMNIINSEGNVKTIEEINLIPEDLLKTLKKNDCFLDYVTGDIFEYKKHLHSWVPFMNVGLHNLKDVEKNNRGALITKQKYRPKSVSKEELVITNNNELRINLVKKNLSHYSLVDLPLEFLAFTTSTWYAHEFCVKNPKLQLKILCESDKGPAVIEHGNSIACNFHICKKYIFTIKLLENFIRNKFFNIVVNTLFIKQNENCYKEKESPNMQKLKDLHNPEKKILEMLKCQGNMANYNDEAEKIKIKRPTSSFIVEQSRQYSNIKTYEKISNHCGYGFNKRDMIFVENNAINNSPIRQKTKINNNENSGNNFQIADIKGLKFLEELSGVRKISHEFKEEKKLNALKSPGNQIKREFEANEKNDLLDQNDVDNHVIKYFKNERNKLAQTLNENFQREKNTINKINIPKSPRILNHSKYFTRNNFSSKDLSPDKTNLEKIEVKQPEINKEFNTNPLAMLFPYTREEFFPKMKKSIRVNTGTEDNKKEKVVEKINLFKSVYSNYNAKFKQYDEEMKKEGNKFGPLLCSSEYITEAQITNKDKMHSKLKWKNKEDFKKFFGKGTSIMNYNLSSGFSASPYVSPSKFSYRDTNNKSKWISKKNFQI